MLSSSCCDNVAEASSDGLESVVVFWLPFESDLFVGITSAIDGYCCCCVDCKSTFNPTGIGGSSRMVGWGIDKDTGGGGIMTKIGVMLWIWIKESLPWGGGGGWTGICCTGDKLTGGVGKLWKNLWLKIV